MLQVYADFCNGTSILERTHSLTKHLLEGSHNFTKLPAASTNIDDVLHISLSIFFSNTVELDTGTVFYLLKAMPLLGIKRPAPAPIPETTTEV